MKLIQYTNGLIELQRGTFDVIVDGVKIPYTGIQRVPLPKVPEKVQKYITQRVIVDYINKETNQIISAKEFNDTIKKLLSNTDGDGEFWSIDDEFKYKKFVASYTENIYENKEIITDIEIEHFICKKISDEYTPHITSRYHIPGFDYKEHSVDLHVNITSIIEEKAKEYGFEAILERPFSSITLKTNQCSIPTNNDEGRYFKISGSYIWPSDSMPFKNMLKRHNITYDEAKKIVDFVREEFSKAFREKIAINKQMSLDKLNTKHIIEALAQIHSHLQRVTPRSNSSNDFAAAKRKLIKLKEDIINEACKS